MDTNHENIVLKDSSGVTMIYDVEERSTHTIALSEDCQLVGRILAAICRTDKGLVSIDLQSGLQMVIPVPSLNGWSLTTGERFLYFGEPSGNQYVLYRYDLERRTTESLGAYNPAGWVIAPEFSDFDVPLIGTRLDETSELVPELYQLTSDGAYQRIGPDLRWSITGFSWSPTEALLGIGASDVSSDAPSYCAATLFITYRVGAHEVNQIAHAPVDTCYTDFSIVARSIWSPDGQKVVLVPSKTYQVLDQELCIVEIDAASQKCLAVLQPNERLGRVAWSPDSQSLVYIVENRTSGDADLRTISIDGLSRTTILAKIASGQDIIDLIWLRARP